MIELNKENFDKETKEGVVLVDIWAPWCPPCRAMGPIVEELSEDFKDDDVIKVTKLNADEYMDIASSLGVTGLPTFLLYKNGEVISKKVGMTTKDFLKEMLNNAKNAE